MSRGELSLASLLLVTSCGTELPQEELGAATSALASPIYLRPTDDATVVSSTHADTNYGADPTLQVDALDSEGGVERSFLQFSVGSVAGRIGRARLRLEVLAPSSNTVDVYAIPDTFWSETTVRWNTQPQRQVILGPTAPLASIVGTTAGQVVYVDVTSAVTPNRTVTFALFPRSTDNADFASKEHPTARRPSLILDQITACAPPASSPTALSACGADSGTRTGGDVSAAMEAAAGVTVTQLTDELTEGSGEWNMITYYDVPALIAGSDRFVFSRVRAASSYAATMTLSGGDSRVIASSPESGKNIFLTPNGAMAYFPHRNTHTGLFDIKATDLVGATCAESPIVSGLAPPGAGEITQLSTVSRSCDTDKWVLAVATDHTLRRFKGKAAGGGPWAPMGSFTLGDPLPSNPFHRIRLSPTCPNIVMYSRDHVVVEPTGELSRTGYKDIFLADLDRPGPSYFLAFGKTAADEGLTTFRKFPSHEMWSNDGLRVAYNQLTESVNSPRKMFIGNILNPDCTFRTVNPSGSTNLEGTSLSAARTFVGTEIPQDEDNDYTPKFCSWSADDTMLACSGYIFSTMDPESDNEGESAIFLMNPSTGNTQFLAKTQESPGNDVYEGQSHLQFAGDKRTILFDSDRLVDGTHLPGQVYKATYPTLPLP